MSGPFREAFVELSQLAFDEIKALGRQTVEAIVVAAEKVVPPAANTYDNAHYEMRHTIMCIASAMAVPWTIHDVTSDERDRQTLVRVRLSCGHVGKFWLDEITMALSYKCELIEYIHSELLKEPEQRCTCGTPAGLGPAGKAL